MMITALLSSNCFKRVAHNNTSFNNFKHPPCSVCKQNRPIFLYFTKKLLEISQIVEPYLCWILSMVDKASSRCCIWVLRSLASSQRAWNCWGACSEARRSITSSFFSWINCTSWKVRHKDGLQRPKNKLGLGQRGNPAMGFRARSATLGKANLPKARQPDRNRSPPLSELTEYSWEHTTAHNQRTA